MVRDVAQAIFFSPNILTHLVEEKVYLRLFFYFKAVITYLKTALRLVKI